MNTQDVRTRILAAARNLFSQKGYGAVSVREIADAVGVTKPTLYYWFTNKDALFHEVLRGEAERLARIVGDSLEQPGDVVARLHDFVRLYLEAAVQDPEGVRLMMRVHFPEDPSQPPFDVMRMHDVALAGLLEVVDRGIADGTLADDVDAPTAAMTLLGAANTHILAALHGMPLPDDVADRILRTLLHGVLR